MRTVVCRAWGAFDTLKVEDMPSPSVGPGQVKLQVHAAGVGFAASLVVAGKHQNRPPLPFSPGTEAAGIVLACGAGVTHVNPGDRVCAGMPYGGFAQEAVATASNTFAIPNKLGFAESTWFTTLYATALGALKWRAMLGPGETLVVHGAAGGSGLAAIEVGKALGARVIAVAGSADKVAAARSHGADESIDHSREDTRERVLALTGGRGANVVFDPVGGAAFDASLRCIAPEGRLVLIGFASGQIPQIPGNLVLVKNITVTGFSWGHYMGWGRQPSDAATQDSVRGAFAELLRWYEQGQLRPLVSQRYPLDRFQEAMAVLLKREVIGKVVLELRA